MPIFFHDRRPADARKHNFRCICALLSERTSPRRRSLLRRGGRTTRAAPARDGMVWRSGSGAARRTSRAGRGPEAARTNLTAARSQTAEYRQELALRLIERSLSSHRSDRRSDVALRIWDYLPHRPCRKRGRSRRICAVGRITKTDEKATTPSPSTRRVIRSRSPPGSRSRAKRRSAPRRKRVTDCCSSAASRPPKVILSMSRSLTAQPNSAGRLRSLSLAVLIDRKCWELNSTFLCQSPGPQSRGKAPSLRLRWHKPRRGR
jgi:hypothetical protein